MMNKTWLVMKTMLKMQYSKAGKSSSQVWAFVIAALFLLPFLGFYIMFVNNMIGALYELLQPFGQESLILGILFLILHILLFFISIATVVSAFYFAEDIQSFIPFPLQPFQLLLGKAANPFLYLYFTAGAVFLPAFYFYGSVSEASILYYLFGVILFLLLPVIPFTIASILVMVVMRFVNIAKNKDRSKVLAGIFSLVFIIGINVLLRLNTNSEAITANFAAFIRERDDLLQLITFFYPPAFVSTLALTESTWLGVLSFAALIGISIGAFLLFIWMGQLLYLKGVLGIGTGNKKKISQKKVRKQMTMRPVWLSYILKELRIIFRTPTFLMQCVIQGLFGPVFILIILMLDSSNDSLAGFMRMFSEKENLLLLFIAVVFILATNATSISSISREGKNWEANLFLPLHPRQIFFSKIATAWTINVITIVLFLVVFIMILQIPAIIILHWLILSLITSWFTSTLGTYLDFLAPKLNWTDEQEVFKARMTGLFSLLYTVGIFGVMVLIIWNMDSIQGLWMTSLILLICLVIIVSIVHKLLQRKINANAQQRL
ncbi:putative ABC transporter permease subunit [Virgibacillus natechei]